MNEETIVENPIINTNTTETKDVANNTLEGETGNTSSDVKMTRIIFALPGDNFKVFNFLDFYNK